MPITNIKQCSISECIEKYVTLTPPSPIKGEGDKEAPPQAAGVDQVDTYKECGCDVLLKGLIAASTSLGAGALVTAAFKDGGPKEPKITSVSDLRKMGDAKILELSMGVAKLFNPPKECPEGKILSDFVLGDLEPLEALNIAGHVVGCRNCFSAVGAMKEVMNSVNPPPSVDPTGSTGGPNGKQEVDRPVEPEWTKKHGKCPEGIELADYLVGDLTPLETTDISTHLKGCKECSSWVGAMKEVMGEVSSSTSSVPPVVTQVPENRKVIAEADKEEIARLEKEFETLFAQQRKEPGRYTEFFFDMIRTKQQLGRLYAKNGDWKAAAHELDFIQTGEAIVLATASKDNDTVSFNAFQKALANSGLKMEMLADLAKALENAKESGRSIQMIYERITDEAVSGKNTKFAKERPYIVLMSAAWAEALGEYAKAQEISERVAAFYDAEGAFLPAAHAKLTLAWILEKRTDEMGKEYRLMTLHEAMSDMEKGPAHDEGRESVKESFMTAVKDVFGAQILEYNLRSELSMIAVRYNRHRSAMMRLISLFAAVGDLIKARERYDSLLNADLEVVTKAVSELLSQSNGKEERIDAFLRFKNSGGVDFVLDGAAGYEGWAKLTPQELKEIQGGIKKTSKQISGLVDAVGRFSVSYNLRNARPEDVDSFMKALQELGLVGSVSPAEMEAARGMVERPELPKPPPESGGKARKGLQRVEKRGREKRRP